MPISELLVPVAEFVAPCCIPLRKNLEAPVVISKLNSISYSTPEVGDHPAKAVKETKGFPVCP